MDSEMEVMKVTPMPQEHGLRSWLVKTPVALVFVPGTYHIGDATIIVPEGSEFVLDVSGSRIRLSTHPILQEVTDGQ